MWILDRYLLRQFVRVFLICFLSLAGLFAVFDAFNNLDEFIAHADKEGNLLLIIAEYYSYRSIALFDRMSGVLTLTSAMFTITWLGRHNEMTAILAAGIPHRRVVRSVLLAGVVISLAAAASREWFIPSIRQELSRSAKDLGGETAQKLRPRYDNKTDILLRGSHTLASDQSIVRPDFLLPPALDRYGRKLVAETAYYHPPQQDRPGGYLLKEVSQPKQLEGKSSLHKDGQPVILTSLEHPQWLAIDECFVVSGVNFEQLTGGQSWRHFSSTRQLVAGLRNRSLDFGADVRVAIHVRLMRPLMDLTLLLLGLPLVLSHDNRNVFVAIGLCVLLVTAFMLLDFGSQYLGSIYLLDPALGAWLPLMIFIPLAAWLAEPLVV